MLRFLIVIILIEGFSLASNVGICTRQVWSTRNVVKTQNVIKRVTSKTWWGSVQIKFVPSTQTYSDIEYKTKTIEVCCQGYVLLRGKCTPLCDKVCENAECTAPNECTCHSGYTKFNKYRCLPYCDNCEYGYCSAPNLCRCYSGYEKDETGTCKPKCQTPCTNGYCSKPDYCTCNAGYILSVVSNLECEPICQEICGDHSTCVAPNKCECIEGYKENSKICEPICTNCQNGLCIAPEDCRCLDGYEKSENNSCIPICKPECVNGHCTGPNICNCYSGYKNVNGVCEPICENPCVNGYCSSPNYCTCNDGYAASMTSNFKCEPVCTSPCQEHSTCTNPGVCECSFGYSIDKLGKCVPVCSSCENGDCIAPEICKCWEGYKQNDTNVCSPICNPQCNHGFCTSPNTCDCFEGYERDENGICQPKCETPCKNGHCSSPNYCSCYTGYSHNSSDSDPLECHPICTVCNNGDCVSPEECHCWNGYVDLDDMGYCIPVCTKPCSFGYCSAPEQCTCFNGYEPDNNSTNSLCKPICLGCENGTCVEPFTCQCFENFIWDSSENTCIYTKVNQNSSADLFNTNQSQIEHNNNEGCNDPCFYNELNKCLCPEISSTTIESVNCETSCLNGFCVEPDICQCWDHYILDFNPTKGYHCIPLCNNDEDGCINGTCIKPNVCECHEGFAISPENNFTCIRETPTVAAITGSTSLWPLLVSIVAILVVAIGLAYYFIRKKFGAKEYNVARNENDRAIVQYSEAANVTVI